MAFAEAIIAMQAEGPYLGRAALCEEYQVSLSESIEVLNEHSERFLAVAEELVEMGASILEFNSTGIFFESKEPVSIDGADIFYFESNEDLRTALGAQKEVAIEFLQSDDESEMHGYEIDEADWREFEDFNNGKRSNLEQQTFEYLEEIGLVEGSSEEPSITDFGQECLNYSLDT